MVADEGVSEEEPWADASVGRDYLDKGSNFGCQQSQVGLVGHEWRRS